MTIGALHRLLGVLIEEGHARKPVAISKGTFTHPLECDGPMILCVNNGSLEWVRMSDDDGGIKQNRDGTESARRMFVLRGDGEL